MQCHSTSCYCLLILCWLNLKRYLKIYTFKTDHFNKQFSFTAMMSKFMWNWKRLHKLPVTTKHLSQSDIIRLVGVYVKHIYSVHCLPFYFNQYPPCKFQLIAKYLQRLQNSSLWQFHLVIVYLYNPHEQYHN